MYLLDFGYRAPCGALYHPRSWTGAILKLMLCVRRTYSTEKSSVRGWRWARNQCQGSERACCGYTRSQLHQQSCSGVDHKPFAGNSRGRADEANKTAGPLTRSPLRLLKTPSDLPHVGADQGTLSPPTSLCPVRKGAR